MVKKRENDLAINRQAFHNYEILETLEAGIALTGTEIKSLRDGGGSVNEAYVMISSKNTVVLKNCNIAQYAFGNIHNHEEKRDRKLLLHKHEIEKLKRAVQIKGCTIIALSIYLKKRFAKVKLAIAKGKKLYDKRQAIKQREQKRKIDSALKEYS